VTAAVATSPTVSLEKQGTVGVIVIDNPPVNATSHSVRAGLVAAVAALTAETDLTAAVIIGKGTGFIAGADIKEFNKPPEAPDLSAVIAAIEACPKPVVAAIHGAALGGGFEVALACDARIAAADASVGLPEVSLGIIPGAGGTQRLPRLTGIAMAIDLIASARRVSARDALGLGMIDAVAERDLLDAAVALALRSGKRLVAHLPVPAEPEADIEAVVATHMKKARGRASIAAAIAAVRSAGRVPVREALAADHAAFHALRTGEEAQALRHLFFAERAARKLDTEAEPQAVATVGIVGGGTMGAGIAAAFAASGFGVILHDSSAEARERAAASVRTALADLGKPAAADAVALADTLAGLAAADVVIEAVFEDMAVKQTVMADLARIALPNAILATNPSYLDVNAIAAATGSAERVVGLHFFAPAHRMRLLEIVQGAATAPAVLATGVALAKRLGKVAVIAGVGEGFIGNRIYSRYRQQCEFMIEDGATPEAIDAAVESLGFAMGPFATSDLSGLDIAWRMRKSKAATRDSRERYVMVADRLCEMGRLGRKSGAGWYDYAEGASRGVPSPIVAEVIAAARPAGIAPRAISAEEIRGRVLGAIVNEAACIVEDGVARSPGDIDVVMVNGYGFSRFRGGPLFQAARLPEADLLRMIDAVGDATGHGFRRGDVGRLLAALRR